MVDSDMLEITEKRPRVSKVPRPVEPDRSISEKKKKSVGLILRGVVTLTLFVFLLKSISLPQIWSAFLHLDPAIALVGLVIGFCTLIVSGYQWQCLLRGERIHIDLTKLVNLYMVGIAFNHFLPTSMGGDIVKIYYVAREGKNMSGSASAAVMARITGFFGMLLVAYPALLIWNAYFSSQVIGLLLSLSSLIFLMVLATFCLALLFTRLARSRVLVRLTTLLLPDFLREKLVRSNILSKGIEIGNTLVASVKKPSPMIGSILFGVIFHVVACLNYFSFGMALHVGIPFYFYLIAIPLVSLVAFLPVSINGFGLRESAMVFVFSTVHVPAATALLLAFIMDIQMLFFGFIGICIYIVMGGQRGKSRYEENGFMMSNGDQNSNRQIDQGATRVDSFCPNATSTETPTANPADWETMRFDSIAPTPGSKGSVAPAVPETQMDSLKGKPGYARFVVLMQKLKAIVGSVRKRKPGYARFVVLMQKLKAIVGSVRKRKFGYTRFVVLMRKLKAIIDSATKGKLEYPRSVVVKQKLKTLFDSATKGKLGYPRPVVFTSIIGVVVVLVGVIILVLHLFNSTASVVAYRTHMQNVNLFIGGNGSLYASQKLNVSFSEAERVTNVYVKPGDQVTKNQPLVQLDLSQLNAQIKQAADNVAAAQSYLNSVAGTVQANAAQLSYDQAVSRYNALQAQASSPTLHNGTLVAPFDALVTAVTVQSGELAKANTGLVTLQSESTLVAHIAVPLVSLPDVFTNQNVLITPSAIPNLTVHGTVSSIIPQSSPATDTFEVWVTIDNTGKQFLPGMSVFARLQEPLHTLVVPRMAVINPDQGATVFVINHGHVTLRRVETGGYVGDLIVIEAGLSDGDEVVLTGVDTLRDGQAVDVSKVRS